MTSQPHRREVRSKDVTTVEDFFDTQGEDPRATERTGSPSALGRTGYVAILAERKLRAVLKSRHVERQASIIAARRQRRRGRIRDADDHDESSGGGGRGRMRWRWPGTASSRARDRPDRAARDHHQLADRTSITQSLTSRPDTVHGPLAPRSRVQDGGPWASSLTRWDARCPGGGEVVVISCARCPCRCRSRGG